MVTKIQPLFTDCTAVKVSLKKEFLDSNKSYAGIYELSSKINGKPSFKFRNKALWYNTKTNNWIIGSIGNLKSDTGAFYTKNKFGGLTDAKNAWNYWKNNEWNTLAPNEIKVECTLASE